MELPPPFPEPPPLHNPHHNPPFAYGHALVPPPPASISTSTSAAPSAPAVTTAAPAPAPTALAPRQTQPGHHATAPPPRTTSTTATTAAANSSSEAAAAAEAWAMHQHQQFVPQLDCNLDPITIWATGVLPPGYEQNRPANGAFRLLQHLVRSPELCPVTIRKQWFCVRSVPLPGNVASQSARDPHDNKQVISVNSKLFSNAAGALDVYSQSKFAFAIFLSVLRELTKPLTGPAQTRTSAAGGPPQPANIACPTCGIKFFCKPALYGHLRVHGGAGAGVRIVLPEEAKGRNKPKAPFEQLMFRGLFGYETTSDDLLQIANVRFTPPANSWYTVSEAWVADLFSREFWGKADVQQRLTPRPARDKTQRSGVAKRKSDPVLPVPHKRPREAPAVSSAAAATSRRPAPPRQGTAPSVSVTREGHGGPVLSSVALSTAAAAPATSTPTVLAVSSAGSRHSLAHTAPQSAPLAMTSLPSTSLGVAPLVVAPRHPSLPPPRTMLQTMTSVATPPPFHRPQQAVPPLYLHPLQYQHQHQHQRQLHPAAVPPRQGNRPIEDVVPPPLNLAAAAPPRG